MANDAVWLDVLPSLKSFGANLARQVVPAARSAGQQAGAGYSKAFKDASSNTAEAKVKELAAAQKQAGDLVTKLAGQVSKARQAQARAAAELLTAEQRLTDATARYGSDSNQAQAAAHRVEAAREKAAQATRDFERAEDSLREAHHDSKRATAELEKAQESLSGEVKKAPTLWGRFKASLSQTSPAADKARAALDRVRTSAINAAKKVGEWGLKVGTTVAAAAATIAGIAIKGGFERALNIEDARAALGALGHDTKAVDAIMQNALASVKGTAFGLGDAATIAATAVAAGIAPGQELERVLTLTANAAALARVGLDEMGSILNKVWTAGRVSTEELNQLADRGIPIWTKLAEAYGVSGSELRDMVSQGAVDAQTFADVLQNTVGDSALAMGDTTRGAWENMMAALSRGGESFLRGIFPMFKEGLEGITGFLDEIGPVAEEAGAAVGAWITDNVVPALQDFGAWFQDEGLPALKDFAGWFKDEVLPKLQALASFLIDDAIPALRDFGGWVVDNKDWLGALAVSLGVTWAALEVLSGVRAISTALAAFSGVTQGATIATTLAAAAQKVWNIAMAGFGGPIGLIIIGITALVAGLVWFFTQTETGKKIWEKFTGALKSAWEAVKTAIGAVVDWFTETVLPVLSGVWDKVTAAADVAWTVLKVIFVTIATAFSLLWELAKAAWEKIGKPIFDGLVAAGQWMWDQVNKYVIEPFAAAWEKLLKGIAWAKDNILAPAWEGLKKIGRGLWDFLDSKVFAPIRNAWDAVGRAFGWVKDNVIAPAWDRVQSLLDVGWRWIQVKVFTPIRKGVAAVGDVFEKTKEVISKAWDKVKEAAAKPVNFIIESVYTNGIKATWDKIADSVGLSLKLPTVSPIKLASGGVLPGYTPGRDVHHFYSPTGGRLDLSGGEAVMRPEFTRAVGGPAGVARLNAAAVGGALGDLPHAHFAGGGVFGWLSGAGDFISGVAGGIKDAVVNVANFLSNPAEGLASLIKRPMESLLGDVMGGPLGQALVEYPRKAVEGLIEKALGLINGMAGDASGPLPSAGGWTRPSRGPVTSRYGPRWGAFHNGIDVAGGGATYAIWNGRVRRVGWNVGYGNTGIGILIGHDNGLESYYGHNPIGGPRVRPGQLVTSGQHIGYQGATGNVTGVHVHHSIFQNGRALNPERYGRFDGGGVIPPGDTYVRNSTGRDELLLNPAQVKAAIARGGDPSDEYARRQADYIADRLGLLGETARDVQQTGKLHRTFERMG